MADIGKPALTDLFVAGDSVAVTPTDNVPAGPYRALRANAAGTIRAKTAAGQMRTMNFTAGETRYIAVSEVWATGTTATGIEGMS